jgi:extradiol dioxygenase family protein
MLSIRTQDRMALVPYSGVLIQYGDDRWQIVSEQADIREIRFHLKKALTLGTYATKERALEVLDEIEKCYKRCYTNNLTTRYNHLEQQLDYQMPKE